MSWVTLGWERNAMFWYPRGDDRRTTCKPNDGGGHIRSPVCPNSGHRTGLCHIPLSSRSHPLTPQPNGCVTVVNAIHPFSLEPQNNNNNRHNQKPAGSSPVRAPRKPEKIKDSLQTARFGIALPTSDIPPDRRGHRRKLQTAPKWGVFVLI